MDVVHVVGGHSSCRAQWGREFPVSWLLLIRSRLHIGNRTGNQAKRAKPDALPAYSLLWSLPVITQALVSAECYWTGQYRQEGCISSSSVSLCLNRSDGSSWAKKNHCRDMAYISVPKAESSLQKMQEKVRCVLPSTQTIYELPLHDCGLGPPPRHLPFTITTSLLYLLPCYPLCFPPVQNTANIRQGRCMSLSTALSIASLKRVSWLIFLIYVLWSCATGYVTVCWLHLFHAPKVNHTACSTQ